MKAMRETDYSQAFILIGVKLLSGIIFILYTLTLIFCVIGTLLLLALGIMFFICFVFSSPVGVSDTSNNTGVLLAQGVCAFGSLVILALFGSWMGQAVFRKLIGRYAIKRKNKSKRKPEITVES